MISTFEYIQIGMLIGFLLGVGITCSVWFSIMKHALKTGTMKFMVKGKWVGGKKNVE